jgi:hypothetical protein
VHLYYVCTEDFRINISRVKNKVALGGHDVTDLAVQNRYVRSLGVLETAVHAVDRIVLFDNSNVGLHLNRALCEIVNEDLGKNWLFHTRIEITPKPHIPKWVIDVLQRAYDRDAHFKPEMRKIKSPSVPLESPEERHARYRLAGTAEMMQLLKRHRMD